MRRDIAKITSTMLGYEGHGILTGLPHRGLRRQRPVERRPAGVSPDACPSCVEDRVRDVESVGPDDDDYLDRPALGRTHPYGNGAV